MTRGSQATPFVRFGLVAALSFALSGAPRTAAAAARTIGLCAQECGGSAGDAGCPPTCPDGVCAKIAPAVIETAPKCGTIAPESGHPGLCDDAEPLAPPPGDGVFHPPTC